jgi:pre-mRNA-splicing factor ATP-dependent RNA helicase DHX16
MSHVPVPLQAQDVIAQLALSWVSPSRPACFAVARAMVEAWVSDELHGLLGFSDSATAAYVVDLGRAAPCASAVVSGLAQYATGIDPAKLSSFAAQLMRRLGRAPSTIADTTPVARPAIDARAEKERRQAEELIRRIAEQERAAAYEMVQEEDEETSAVAALVSVREESKEERRERKRLGRDRRAAASAAPRLRAVAGVETAQDGHRVGVQKRRRAEKKTVGPDSPVERGQEPNAVEEDADIRERDEFAERVRLRDRGGVKERVEEVGTGGERTQIDPPDNDTVARLRELSRRTYLTKREAKKLEQLREDIEDERLLFQGEHLSGREKRDLALKEELYRLASSRVKDLREDGPDESDGRGRSRRTARYRMPDAYGDAQVKRTDREKRMETLTARYEERDDLVSAADAAKARRSTTDQGRWEEEQIRKAASAISEGAAGVGGEYDLVFDPIEFVSAADGRILDTGGSKQLRRKSAAAALASAREEEKRDQREAMRQQRESLPMFQYREALLKAVKEYQVLVVVSETGSGKTTQIPQYLIETGFGAVACTQPRRVAAMSVAARVAEEMGVKLGAEVGYSIRFEDCTSDKTVIKYMTDGMLLREFLSEPDLARYNVIIVDEAHERSLSTDIVMGLVKDIARFRGDDIRVIISSATLNAEKFSSYFDDAPVFKIPGRMYGVDVLYSKVPQADYLDACCVTVLQIHATQPPGDILVFLTGQDEIETAEESLKLRTRGLGSKLGELVIAPIYATLPSDLQAKIFDPTPPGARKVVLATNIAETSVTIPGIVYVIDPGFCKQKSYNAKTGMESLLVVPVSQAGAIQRAGRAGRTQPGKCFRLYTKWSFHNEMESDTIPEILRTNLAQVVLMIEFDFIDVPPVEVLSRSLEQLYALGALNDRGQLTKLGRRMAELPLDPMMAKALLASEQYKCSDEVATICSMLSVNNAVFYRPKDKKLLADAAHAAFARGGGGDHIKLLNCYVQWRDSGFSTQWCYENYVQARTIKKARDVREQLDGLLERVEIENVTAGAGNFEPVLKSLTAGFFYNACRLQRNGQYRTVKTPHTVQIHPSSSLAKSEAPPRWLIYHELVFTSSEFMRQVFAIESDWLLEVAPHFYDEKDLKDDLKHNKKRPKKRSK